MVTTVSKFRDDLSGKLFDNIEDAIVSEYKHRYIQNAFSFYDEVVDDTRNFQNGEFCVQRDEDFYNRLLDAFLDCIKKWYPEIISKYTKVVGTLDKESLFDRKSFANMWMSEELTDSNALFKWWCIQSNICPVCFREYGQMCYVQNCKHDGSIPTIDLYKEKKILAKSFRDAMNKTRYMDAMMMREAFEEAVTDVCERSITPC